MGIIPDASVGTIFNLTKKARLPSYSVPGTTLKRYRRSDLDQLLEGGLVPVNSSMAEARVAGPSSDIGSHGGGSQ